MTDTPIDRQIAREAANWFVRLQHADASTADKAACAQWRALHHDHERAWQLAERFSGRAQQLSGAVGRSVLERPHSLERRRVLKTLALLISAAPLAIVAQRTLPWREWQADERTATGEQRTLPLPDGGQIRLNTDSAVDIAYDQQQRRVRLISGEILVEAPRDEQTRRPFIVGSADAELLPQGARLLLRQYAQITYVAVLEGDVEIRPRRLPDDLPGLRLTAGQQAQVSAQRVGRIEAVAASHLGWLQGVLRAEKMRLGDFISELQRYRPGLLRCDPAVAELLISGAFQLRDTDQVLRALSQTLPVSIHYRTAYWVTVAPRTA